MSSWLHSISTVIFGGSSNDNDDNQVDDSPDLLMVEGSFYLDRKDSIRGSHECLFPKATLTLRKTSTPHTFQLIVTRILDEDDFNEEDHFVENVFIVSHKMRFHTSLLPPDNLPTFRWIELEGSSDDIYEFAIPGSLKSPNFIMFRTIWLQCIYQRLHMRSHVNASNHELEDLVWSPTPSQKVSHMQQVPTTPKQSPMPINSSTPTSKSILTPKPSSPSPSPIDQPSTQNLYSLLPKPGALPSNLDLLLELDAEIFVFLVNLGQFQLVDSSATVQLWTDPKDITNPWLAVESGKGLLVCQQLSSSMNHMFWPDQCAMIWNLFYSTGTGKKEECLSVSVNLGTDPEFKEFRRAFTQIHVQATLESSLAQMQLDDSDLQYLEEQASNDTKCSVEDDNGPLSDDDSENEEDEDEAQSQSAYTNVDDNVNLDSQRATSPAAENSLLTTTKSRAFVVRGGSIGIFGFTGRGKVKFETMMQSLKFNRAPLKPSQVLLHQNDERMILVDKTRDANKAYELDLQSETIVNEFSLPEGRHVVDLSTATKSTEHASGLDPTFLGVSGQSVFRVDTRINQGHVGNGENDQYTYTSKNIGLQSIVSNAKGQVAVGSKKGELRLYNHVGKRATTTLQSAGEPIIHLDVSVDGQYVLATTRTALLLFDVAHVKKGGDELTTAFSTRLPSAGRPNAIRLALRPQHVAQMDGHPVQFTKAYFNVSDVGETSLITSTGPYVITWSMADVLNQNVTKYTIKQYGDVVVADQFRFGDDQNIVLALPNDVQSVNRRHLRRF